jgi:hypothetical protein
VPSEKQAYRRSEQRSFFPLLVDAVSIAFAIFALALAVTSTVTPRVEPGSAEPESDRRVDAVHQ